MSTQPKIINDRSNARKAAIRASEKTGVKHEVQPAPDGAKGFIVVAIEAPEIGDELPPKRLDAAEDAAPEPSYPAVAEYAELERPEGAEPAPIDPPQVFDPAQTVLGGMEEAVADLAMKQAERLLPEGEAGDDEWAGVDWPMPDAGPQGDPGEDVEGNAEPIEVAAVAEEAPEEATPEEDYNVTLVFSCTPSEAKAMASLVATRLKRVVKVAYGEDFPPTAYAFTVDGDTGRKPRAPKAATAPRAPKAAPAGGKRAEAQAAAEASARTGTLPQPPDFSKPTHKSYRKKLAALVALAEAGDLAGLRAFPIQPVSTTRKMLDRYRNLAVLALESRG